MKDIFYRIYNRKSKRFISSRSSDIWRNLQSIKRAISGFKARYKHIEEEDLVVVEYSNSENAYLYKDKEFSKVNKQAYQIIFGGEVNE